jgi:hypothetical protein
MLINPSSRKQLIAFLLLRWKRMICFAAVERVYIASCRYAKKNEKPEPEMPILAIALPGKQIEIIKQHITMILPEAGFINYEYEAPAPLDPEDFIEVFESDHHQCIGKVEDVMQKMQIQ